MRTGCSFRPGRCFRLLRYAFVAICSRFQKYSTAQEYYILFDFFLNKIMETFRMISSISP